MGIIYWSEIGTGISFGTLNNGTFTVTGVRDSSGQWWIEGDGATLSIGDTVTMRVQGSPVGSGPYAGFVTIGGTQYPVLLLEGGPDALLVGYRAGGATSYVLDTRIICYLAGTRILTARGEVAVEALVAGDLVATRFGGLRPVRWIGRQGFDGRLLGARNAPVRFLAGALGVGMPIRDLMVSPDHSMVVDDHLVPARLLVNGVTVVQEAVWGRVDYLHVDLGPHDLVLAEGVWSESYAAMGNRQGFHNAGDFDGEERVEAMCLPQVGGEDGRLPGLRARVMRHVPGACFGADAALHLVADGQRVVGQAGAAGELRFRVPAGVRRLRLGSRSTCPAVLGESDDHRILGFRVTGLGVSPDQGAAWSCGLETLAAGWHAAEAGWRRTDGDGDLAPLLAEGGGGAFWLSVRGTGLTRYLAEGAGQKLAA
jgi:hypothetical protein